MPKPMQFKTGSLIYAQGEDADKVYVLQDGKVSLVYEDIETGNDMREQVQPGEFFGIKSALGRYPREENAIVIDDSILMVFTIPEFETMAVSNTKIIFKMLKVLSNQMRRIHLQVSNLIEKKPEDPDAGLFLLGEKFLKRKRFSHAQYVFKSYLTHYPSGKYSIQALNHLQLAEISLACTDDDQGKNISGSKGGKG